MESAAAACKVLQQELSNIQPQKVSNKKTYQNGNLMSLKNVWKSISVGETKLFVPLTGSEKLQLKTGKAKLFMYSSISFFYF